MDYGCGTYTSAGLGDIPLSRHLVSSRVIAQPIRKDYPSADAAIYVRGSCKVPSGLRVTDIEEYMYPIAVSVGINPWAPWRDT